VRPPGEAGDAAEVADLRARVAELELALAMVRADIGSAAEARLQALLESSPAGIAIWDAEDRLVAFNSQYPAIFFAGHEDKVRVGLTFAEQSAIYLSLGRNTAVAGVTHDFFRERQRRRRTPGEPFEQRVGDRWIISRESRTPEGGMISVHIDTTPLRRAAEALEESEARFRVMADTMPALLWMDDADGRCVFVNKTWLDYTGRTMAEELGLGWTKAIHPDDVSATMTIESEARRSRKPFTEVYRLRRADGEYRWFLDSGTPRFAGDGAFLGFIGTLIDITDRRHLEAELHQAQKMEAIGQLTGGVAHDFNNLLTVISGNIELALGRVGGDPLLTGMLRLAMEAAEKGAALTHRLLAFARRQTLSPYALDLASLVADLGELLRRTLGSGVEIATSVAADLWPALVDRSQLENAVLNLAINARDAMPGGGRLTISAANREVAEGEFPDVKPGRYVALTVRDVGHGMSQEVLAKAVQPFFTTKETGKGSGLGLSMVYGFVKQSGGHLEITSEVDRGTTVRLILPVASRYMRPKSATAEEDEALLQQGGSVLVVDDDPDVLNVAVSMLESLGHRVTTAVDAASALRWVNEGGPFDVLLTDIVLPGGMNGVQLAAAALELRPELRILLMSGYTEHALEQKDFSALLLHKPFRRRELAEKLRLTLGR
jgi:PAS domain S-box-containing protein